MAKEYIGFNEDEKAKLMQEYMSNIAELNKGIEDEEKIIVPDLEEFERKLDDPKEIKVYRISQQIVENGKKREEEKKRLKEAYGEPTPERDYLARTFRYLLRIGGTEEDRLYNDNIYQMYLKNPEAVLQQAVNAALSFNPSGYFEAIEKGDLSEELEYFYENEAIMRLGFALAPDISNNADKITSQGEHNNGIRLSKEFLNSYTSPLQATFMLGGSGNQIKVTSTTDYFTIPKIPLDELYKMKTSKIDQSFFVFKVLPHAQIYDNGNMQYIKELKKHPELKVGDNFFLKYKATTIKDGKEVEIPITDALVSSDEVKFSERSQEEMDILLNPIDKNYSKFLTGEITQEELDELELKDMLAEVEDFVKTPYKYHKYNVDFTKPLTEEEKANFEKEYKESVRIYNKVLPKNMQIKLDVEGLRKRMNDPKEIEIYRRAKYIVEKEEKQSKLFEQYKDQQHITNTTKIPLARDLFRLMRIDGSPESENFNKRLVNLYAKHPYEVANAVLKGEYSADTSVYNGVIMDDYERMKVYFDNFENVRLSWNEVFLKSTIGNDSFVKGLDVNISNFLQKRGSVGSGFDHPDAIFGQPKMTKEQIAICLYGKDKELTDEYRHKISDAWTDTAIETDREEFKLFKEKGIFDDKETVLSYKAVEFKDGKEKEIKLIDALKALKSKKPNVKIVKRSEEEKEKLLYVTIANYKKSHMDEVKNNMEKFKADFVSSYNAKNPETKIDKFNQDMILDQNKGGFFERTFNTTSNEYKAFATILKNYTDEKSPDFSNDQKLVAKAKAYLKHKNVTDEHSIERLDKTGRNRVKLCQAIIEAMDKQPELLVNVRENLFNNHTEIKKVANMDKGPEREPVKDLETDANIEKSNKLKENNKVETKNKTVIIENDISKN